MCQLKYSVATSEEPSNLRDNPKLNFSMLGYLKKESHILNVCGLYRNDDLVGSLNQPWYAMAMDINTMMSIICYQFLFTMVILKLQTNFIMSTSCAYISN